MYDIIIVGKGPAGISASLYTARANLKTLIIGKTSSLIKSHLVDNYYGFVHGVPGEELLRQGENQALKFGTEIIDDEVIALEYDFDGKFTVKTKNNYFEARSVLLATGSEKLRIPIKNMERFEGKGVHYCTTCDGYFYRGKKVAILGYNEYAQYEAEEMKQFTDRITILTNGNDIKVDFGSIDINKNRIASLEGGEYIDEVVFSDGGSEKFDGIFVAYGTASSVDFARKLGITISNNIIDVDENQKTNLDGLYAAGDCASKIKQVSVSVGQGALAGLKIIEYIKNLGR
jgi:thioredoxin reductase (NADPH)